MGLQANADLVAAWVENATLRERVEAADETIRALVALLRDCEMDALGWASHAPALCAQGYDAEYSGALAGRISAALASVDQAGKPQCG